MENQVTLNGELAKELMTGATLVFCKFSGTDWFALTKSLKGDEWSFIQYETMSNIDVAEFRLMRTMNHTPKESLKEIEKDYYASMFAKTRQTSY